MLGPSTRARFLYTGIGSTILVVLFDLTILVFWSQWHYHQDTISSGGLRLIGQLVLALGLTTVLAFPVSAVGAGLGLMLGVLAREWRYGDRYGLAIIGGIVVAIGCAGVQHSLFGTRVSAVIGAAVLGAVTGLLPGSVLVAARRRGTTLGQPASAPIAPPAPHRPKAPNLVWSATVNAALGTQAVIALWLALGVPAAMIWTSTSWVTSVDSLRYAFLVLSVPATPVAAILGAGLGWLIATTPVGRTQRRAQFAGGALASAVPVIVGLALGLSVTAVALVEAAAGWTASAVLVKLGSWFGSPVVLVSMAVTLALGIPAGSGLGAHLFLEKRGAELT